jgi:hypothetical protein
MGVPAVTWSEASKLMSELVAPDWWISTASRFGPATSDVAGIAKPKKVDSSAPPTAVDASVAEPIAPAGRLLRATSTPFR